MNATRFSISDGRRPLQWRHLPAFTLIELLVVISIIAVLMSMLLPALASARDEGKRVKCAANLQQLGIALAGCQSEYNGFYPMWDDGERSTVHNRISATWVDSLKQRRMLGVDAGYCPSDMRPDFLNAQRGAAWDFRYPPPQTNQGEVGGQDYSYGISVPLASGAHVSADVVTINGVVEQTRALMQRNVSRRVLVGDGFWNWIHNMSGHGLRFNRWDAGGNWFSNAAGYRHGLERSYRPSGNFLKQDLHVEKATFDISHFNKGIDTNKHFISFPGEGLLDYPVLAGNPPGTATTPAGAPPAANYPADIDPYEITGAASGGLWLGEIRHRKGWDY